MGIFALTSEKLTVNSVDYQDKIKSATLTLDAANLDSTTMGSDGWVEAEGGLKSATLAVTFLDDMADNDIDEELFAILGTKVTFGLRPTDAAVGAGNAEYQGTVLITGHSVGGDVGTLAQKQLSWPTSGAVTRAVA